MDANGVKYEKMEITYFTTEYRGVVAKEDIKKDEIILVVPYDMCITL